MIRFLRCSQGKKKIKDFKMIKLIYMKNFSGYLDEEMTKIFSFKDNYNFNFDDGYVENNEIAISSIIFTYYLRIKAYCELNDV